MINNTNIEPTGYYVLVRMKDVEEKSASGIIVSTSKDLQREKAGQSVGQILEIGPRAFRGLSNGCDSAEDWGVKVGDWVEYNSYDGKIPKGGADDSLRLIADQHIVGKIKDEGKL